MGPAARLPGRADRPPAHRARDPHRGRGHRPAPRRDQAHVGELRRQAQHALGRGLHRPARDQRERARALHGAQRAGRASTSTASSSSCATARSSPRARRSATTTCSARCRPTTARGAWASSASARTSASSRPTGTILFDEKIGGTVHLALGRSYTETGGKNASALHWDLICDLRDGGLLSMDGEPLRARRPLRGARSVGPERCRRMLRRLVVRFSPLRGVPNDVPDRGPDGEEGLLDADGGRDAGSIRPAGIGLGEALELRGERPRPRPRAPAGAVADHRERRAVGVQERHGRRHGAVASHRCP